ncbi:MAG: hypothetical protein LKH08_04305 [Atopobiaceae bacterium]|jgi:hypothetical protein|nr:hypothetical protein [Atopobiaceae bacterium]MCH4119109.1 hypothetical protein [Atopobiaceae bacterium]MCI1388632.1 hypothetical protein [Atopobiaceae bacterium]MCI1432131.1 hypothetical protein [Atopobiaceae bacterium]MCI1470589.1 hypothetical protein [Atopobiaceae bacterium]
MARGGIRRLIRRARARIALDRRTFVLYMVLRALVLLTLIRCVVTARWEGVAICVLSLVLFLVPALLEEGARLDIPPLFQAIIYTFIYAAEILGEIEHYYELVPGWDTVLHTINGFLCAAVGFSLVDLLNRSSKKLNLSPVYVTLVAFCFSMTIGVLWEFLEFGIDSFFGMDMQKDTLVTSISSVALDPTNQGVRVHVDGITRTLVETSSGATTVIDGGYLDIGLIDTMKDLLVNFVGAVAFSAIGYGHLVRHDGFGWTEGLHVRPTTDDAYAKEQETIERMAPSRRSRCARQGKAAEEPVLPDDAGAQGTSDAGA